ncbi:hypothetical protein QE152_g19025 [Popillia japonica]|uniref:Uncharacterized protein n=1 Tax=Popillia japonica TaxID=7064 RepID=A0AAW1L4T4_POPJA
MALIGTIEPFKGNPEEFESYLERIEHLFKVNVVLEDMKVSMFITLAGSSVYQTLKNLAAPRKPVELTYPEVTSLLSKHYAPPVSEIYERFIFNKCVQKSDQSIAEYIVELPQAGEAAEKQVRSLGDSCHSDASVDYISHPRRKVFDQVSGKQHPRKKSSVVSTSTCGKCGRVLCINNVGFSVSPHK